MEKVLFSDEWIVAAFATLADEDGGIDASDIMYVIKGMRNAMQAHIDHLEAEADPEALQIVYWMGFYAGRDRALLGRDAE